MILWIRLRRGSFDKQRPNTSNPTLQLHFLYDSLRRLTGQHRHNTMPPSAPKSEEPPTPMHVEEDDEPDDWYFIPLPAIEKALADVDNGRDKRILDTGCAGMSPWSQRSRLA